MNTLFPISSLTLLALALCGCTAQPAAEVAPVAPVAPSKTTPTEVAPVATTAPNNEDERYRATSAEDQQPAPDDTPETFAIYQKAMKQVHQARPPLDMKTPDTARLIMQTSRGPITLELDGKAAPLHVKSFVYLAGKGFYDGTIFHRHADLTGDGQGFIIQGGDPLTKIPEAAGLAGRGGPGYETPREKNRLTHEKLVIAAARTMDPDSAGSQFYITQGAVTFLDEGDGYTVFGKVVEGKEVALKLKQDDKLQRVKVESAAKASASVKPE